MSSSDDRIRVSSGSQPPEPAWLEAIHLRTVENTWDAVGLPASSRPVCSCGFRGAPEPSHDTAVRTLDRHWRLVQEVNPVPGNTGCLSRPSERRLPDAGS
jgi:hypothetical protein